MLLYNKFMEDILRTVKIATKAFHTADHLAYVSYPLLKDNKLLLAITQNLYLAGVNGLDAVLHYERMYKRLNIIPIDVESKILLFETKIESKINVPGVSKVIKDLRFITRHHRDSKMEFSRKEKFIICSEDYSMMKTIDIEMLKTYIVVMRSFIYVLNGLK